MRSLSKKVIPGAALAALMLSAAPALAQSTEFRGGGFLSDFTQQCATDGWTGTVQVVARMRPAGLSGNSPTLNILNLFIGNYALHMRYPTAAVGTASTADQWAGIGGGFGVNGTPMPQVRLIASPAGTVFNAATERHMLAEILNFAGVANCTARLNVWLHVR